MQKVNSLTFDQASDIQGILVDYQHDIDDAKKNYNSNNNNDTSNSNMVGGNSGINAKLSEIDRDANDQIEDVMKDKQMDAYLFVKKDWWDNIKDRVYGSSSQNPMNNENNMNNNNMMNNDNMNNNNMNNENPNLNKQNQNETPQNNTQQNRNNAIPDSTQSDTTGYNNR